MSPVQIFLIALFIYLGSIGSIVGNTIGWYTLGRPLVAAFVVGLIMGDVPTAMAIGIPLQIMYMGNVTPGGAVAWDLSYATYIGTAAALALGQGDFASIIPGWVTTLLSVFGGMMAALGMGIILSFLLKKQYHIVIFLAGFILVTYFGLSTMAVAVVSVITAVLYFVAYDKVKVEA